MARHGLQTDLKAFLPHLTGKKSSHPEILATQSLRTGLGMGEDSGRTRLSLTASTSSLNVDIHSWLSLSTSSSDTESGEGVRSISQARPFQKSSSSPVEKLGYLRRNRWPRSPRISSWLVVQRAEPAAHQWSFHAGTRSFVLKKFQDSAASVVQTARMVPELSPSSESTAWSASNAPSPSGSGCFRTIPLNSAGVRRRGAGGASEPFPTIQRKKEVMNGTD